jgi:hypothetical protein
VATRNCPTAANGSVHQTAADRGGFHCRQPTVRGAERRLCACQVWDDPDFGCDQIHQFGAALTASQSLRHGGEKPSPLPGRLLGQPIAAILPKFS